MLFVEAKDPSIWRKIRTDEKYAVFREVLLASYEEIRESEIEPLSFSKYKIYTLTGSRKEYEALYSARRKRRNIITALCLIFGDDEYFEKLEDIIWEVCNEFSWALPAHTAKVQIEEVHDFIDLFAAETGFALAEISYLLDDRLSEMIKRRIKLEIEKRIFHSFEKRSFWWETAENNWAAVCGGSVAAAYMYMAPGRFSRVEGRIDGIMSAFLAGFENDGACKEGLGYWTYGFGFFVYYGALLKEFTQGKKDVLSDKKIMEIAKFQQRAYLQGDVIITFADANIKLNKYNMGLAAYLKGIYKEGFSIPPVSCALTLGESKDQRWAHFIRDLAWVLPKENEAIKKETVFLDDSQVFISKQDDFAFAVKGGDNGEPHNHNDVGTFIFAYENSQAITDFGVGEYNRKYFDPLTRYNLLVNSSRGHSVPIINGEYQKTGKAYGGEIISVTDDLFEADISKAYDIPSLKKLVRKCRVVQNGVEITDTFIFEKDVQSIVERLTSWTKPEVSAGAVRLANVICRYDPSVFDCSVTEEIYKGVGGIDVSAYLIDLTAKNISTETVLQFIVEKC